MHSSKADADLRRSLDEIAAVLERHRVLDSLAHRQNAPNRDLLEELQRRQNLVDMQRRVRSLHAADLAFVLQSLPQDDRVLLWGEIDPHQAADTLLELEPAVRDPLIAATDHGQLKTIVGQLDLPDLAWLSEAIPPDVMREVSSQLESSQQ